MQARAAQVGVTLSVEDVKADLKAEIRDLRRMIGKLAATYVTDGEHDYSGQRHADQLYGAVSADYHEPDGHHQFAGRISDAPGRCRISK